MKKITLLLLSILFSLTCSLHAQKQFAGEISYQTKLEGTDDPNLLSSIENQTIDVSILGNKSKTVMKNEMASQAVVWDGDKESAYILIEITGMGKFYKKWNTEQHKDNLKFNDYKYVHEDDFKTICDYKCQKVVATITNLEDDSTSELIFYVTKEIGASKLNGFEYPGLEGYPLLMMTPLDQYCDGCLMMMEAVKITPKKIKDVDFLLPDDAKNIDDDPELREMFGIKD